MMKLIGKGMRKCLGKMRVLTGLLLIASYSAQLQAFEVKDLNTENLNEWLSEGKLNYKSNKYKGSYFYTWTQTDSHFKLELREKSMVGSVLGSVEGELWGEPSSILITGETTEMLTELVEQDLLTASAFWLRGLPEDEQAVVTKKDDVTEKLSSSSIAGKQWQVQFKDYFSFNHYPFPQKVLLESDKIKIEWETLRVETSYISSWCQPTSELAENETEEVDNDSQLKERTNAELEQFFSVKKENNKWLNTQDFCEQLALLHGGAIDSKQGLFGPESMMWELNRYIMPAGFGAGRALLLQVAHPWVTAGIDEHSDVRDDPLERGRRTFTYMYTMIYGSVPQAMNAANEVHQIHKQIQGKLPFDAGRFKAGSEYRANEIEAMIWVNATLWDTLVLTYEALERKLTYEEKERFYQETKLFAMLFGIPKEQMPATWNDFQQYMKFMVRHLEVTDASRQLADDLFHQKNPALMILMPIQKNFTKNTLPPKVAKEYNLETGWFSERFYNTMLIGAKIGDRLLLPQVRYNPVYREAKARTEGKKSGFLIRSSLKASTRQSTLVN